MGSAVTGIASPAARLTQIHSSADHPAGSGEAHVRSVHIGIESGADYFGDNSVAVQPSRSGQYGDVHQEPGMSREAAKKIIDLMVRHAAEQNAALVEVQGICTEDDFREYKQMIGRSMGSMLLDVVYPIVERYPDLKPPQLD
jgi:hypothetical protein